MQYPAAWVFAAVEYGVGSRSKPVAFRISSSVGSSMAAVPGGAKQGRAQKSRPRASMGRRPRAGEGYAFDAYPFIGQGDGQGPEPSREMVIPGSSS